ncbi:hypothetical protein I79_011080 [Cricetulus griseus]|uniref:Uncharacterized protein n=1 Tax=Cricetulus griseus TaxID=10029 RepID=G3HK63_CRIGR|nr:hypothetical protein I79_011080 [Cricetulus griseus]
MLSIKPSLSSTAITDLTQWPRRELSPADHRVSRQELRGWAPKRHGASCACVRFFQYRRVPAGRFTSYGPHSQNYFPVTSRGRSSRPGRSHFREPSAEVLPSPAPLSLS